MSKNQAEAETEKRDLVQELLDLRSQIPQFQSWTVFRHPMRGHDVWLRDYLLELTDYLSERYAHQPTDSEKEEISASETQAPHSPIVINKTGDKWREVRGITCPKCDPKREHPDYLKSVREGYLKYLMFDHFKCKICGTTLVDTGRVTQISAPDSDAVREWEAIQFSGFVDGKKEHNSWDIYCGDELIEGDLTKNEANRIVAAHNKTLAAAPARQEEVGT